MKRPLVASLLVPFAAIALASGAGIDLAGTYRLRLSAEAVAVARALRRPEPTGLLRLAANRTFVLEEATGSNARKIAGRYDVDGSDLVLAFDDGRRVRASGSPERVVLDGLSYVREAPLSVVGVWTVRRNGVEDRSIRLTFGRDGRFGFVSTGARSSGRYEVRDKLLTLLWTEVDGEAVTLGSMRKEIVLNEGGASFNIDTYRYERAAER